MAVLTTIFLLLLTSPFIKCQSSITSTVSDFTSTTIDIFPTSSLASTSSSSTTVTETPTPISLASATVDCPCDLKSESCDVDCCCDSDCTPNELQLFSQCTDALQDKGCSNNVGGLLKLSALVVHPRFNPLNSVSSFCINEGLVFRTSLSHSVLSGLFCIYTDNYPGRREFSSLDTVSSLSEASDKVTEFGSTASNVLSVSSLEPYESEYYRSSDPIEIIFDNDALGVLPLPVSLNGALCNDGNPVTYLNDQSSTCSRYLSSDGAECSSSSPLNAEVFYTNFSVLAFPSSMQTDNYTSIPIIMNRITCYNLIGEIMSCDSDELTPAYDSTLSICNNTLLSVSYVIEHNATQGLLSVSASISIGQVPPGYTTQSFSVQFMYYNDSSSQTLVRPGNPGYIPHEPVLAGIATGSSINVSADSSNWLTVAMGDDKGLCTGQRDSVTFKDSYRSSCILKVSLDSVFSGCEDLDTISVLLGSQPRIDRLAIYGNANVSDLSQWVELLGLDDEFIPVQLGCSNVVTGVHLIIFYTYTGSVSSPIAAITGAQVKYITQDIQPQCVIPSCSLPSPDIPVILESIVTFIPVYEPPDEVLLSTMITIRRLPHDFLYPLFTGSSSGCCTINDAINIFVITLSVLLSTL